LAPFRERVLIAALFVAFVTSAMAQESKATLRIEVTSDSMAVSEAEVTVNGRALRAGEDGILVTSVSLGIVEIGVSKSGFFPATASINAYDAREFVVRVELQPQNEVKEEIKVYATRNDIRIEDSPLHVEVLQREEIEEKMMMTPGDIVMMLNEMGGMRVQTTSPSLGAASVRVQGMKGR
jgi:iron complex outermembrane receptor protein